MKNTLFLLIGLILSIYFLSYTLQNLFSHTPQHTPINKEALKPNSALQQDSNTSSLPIEETIVDLELSPSPIPIDKPKSTPPKIEIQDKNNSNTQEEIPEEPLMEEKLQTPTPLKQHFKPSNDINITALLGHTTYREKRLKIKAKKQPNGVVKVKLSIKHDMLTPKQAKSQNKSVNFITHIYGIVNNRVVYDASTSQFLSTNPLIKFQFKGAQKGDKLTIICEQLKGQPFGGSKKIK